MTAGLVSDLSSSFRVGIFAVLRAVLNAGVLMLAVANFRATTLDLFYHFYSFLVMLFA